MRRRRILAGASLWPFLPAGEAGARLPSPETGFGSFPENLPGLPETAADVLIVGSGAAGLAAGAADQALANPQRPAAFACLTEREWEVARLVAEGLDNREIAAEAYLSEGTVRNNISNILSKMSLKNRTQIAVTFWKSREN